MLSGQGESVAYGDEDLAHLVALYDDEIFYFDEMFDELLEELEDTDLLEDTILILVSDHGEAFLEHGAVKHCHTLFDNEIKSPLIIRVPELAVAGFRDQPVGNIDVLPTVLDYLGLERDGLGLMGQSLRPMIDDPGPVERTVYSSQTDLRSLYDGRFKLIFDVETLEARLFDLRADPAEERDSSELHAARSSQLRDRLVETAAALSGDSLEGAARIGEETEEHLRAIGYLQ
jgi:arylsulfatase A-like enzyme